MQPLLKVENLKKNYGKTTILKKIDLDINKGDIIAITGENGSGKSTLLKLIAGINIPSNGRVINLKENLKLGFVPDKFPDETKFNINEYIRFLGSINNLSKKFIENKLNELLKIFQLEQYNKKRINTFSKGMMQKVNIMQGVLNNPDILILDEPLSGLDYLAQKEIKNIMDSLYKNGVSIIFTSHEIKLIEEISTRIIRIDKGIITQEKKNNTTKVKIIFFMSLSSFEDRVISKSTVKILKNQDNSHSIIVDYEESNEILKSILNNGGKVAEVIKVN